jgi:site-specific recombinase XerC
MYPKFTTPKTLTAQEQGRLLRAVRAQGSRRDRAILSLALGTGLRLRELAGLNVGDVSAERSAVAWKVRLDPKITKGGRGGVAFLNTGVRGELRLYLRWKHRAKEPLETRSPLFLSNQRRRLCLRQIQVLFRKWQTAAGFETLYPFHALRHSAITNVYRATKDLYLTQRFARHSSPLTTTIYTHPSDEELYAALKRGR